MFRAVADGRVKAIWIMATNPVDSHAGRRQGRGGDLKACPFVVVSDVIASTDTMRFAHVALPATAWGEKDGTVTNSERRISRQRPFLATPGEARHDWAIIARGRPPHGLRRRLRLCDRPPDFRRTCSAVAPWRTTARATSTSAPSPKIGETDYDALSPSSGRARAPTRPPRRASSRDGGFFTPTARRRFVPVSAKPETRDSESFPLILNTGRVRDHWHTMTRTGKSPRLSQHLAEPFVEIHPSDAAEHRIVEPPTL